MDNIMSTQSFSTHGDENGTYNVSAYTVPYIFRFGNDVCLNETNNESIVHGQGLNGAVIAIIEFCQAIFTCTANAFTILAVVKTPRLRTLANMYVVSLAISDALTGFFLFYDFLLHFIGEVADKNFFVCSSMLMFLFATLAESVLCIICISFERYMYICYPFKYEVLFTTRSVKISIGLTWLISLTFSMVPLAISYDSDFKECSYGFLPESFYYFGIGLFFYIPLCLCLFMHIAILRVAVYHRRKLNSTVFVMSEKKVIKAPVIVHHMKMIKTFLIINILFYVCWFPWVTCSIIKQYVCINVYLMDVFNIIGLASGGMNFIVYALLNEDFRRSFKRLICGIVKTRTAVTTSDT